jgi:hypothetical protein
MKTAVKALIGLLSHGFILSLGFFLGFLFPRIIHLSQSRATELPPEFLIYIPLVLVGAFSALIPMVWYIVYLIKNPKFSSTQRIVWILLIAFMGALAVPAFFWVVFLHHPSDEPFFGSSQGVAHA